MFKPRAPEINVLLNSTYKQNGYTFTDTRQCFEKNYSSNSIRILVPIQDMSHLIKQAILYYINQTFTLTYKEYD